MDIIFFYLIALIPLMVSIGFWIFNKNIHIIESIILTIIGFIISIIFHYSAINGMASDIQTYSGSILTAKKYSEWTEFYYKEIYKDETYYTTETRTRTVNGKTERYTERVRHTREVFSHLEPRTRIHPEHFECSDTLDRTFSIDKSRFIDIATKFGQTKAQPGKRSNWGYRERGNTFKSGDQNDYVAINNNHYIYPVTDVKTWENKIKACPSIFSYIKVPDNIISSLFEYPKNNNKFISDRLVGNPSFNIIEWDQMNAKLGPMKKINVIAVNFPLKSDSTIADYLESYWIGGKKNDLVICFNSIKPTWCKTFGWTESNIVKNNINSIILNNKINSQSLKLIESEIIKNYKIKDWSKFDYLTVDIPMSYFIWCFIIQIIIIICWLILSIKLEIENIFNIND
jgi:hypothetical protein